MTVFYCARTNGFFDDDWSTSIPGDAVKISAEARDKLFAQVSHGRHIVCGPDGLPMIFTPPPVEATLGDLVAKIDAAADQARLIVVGDPLRAVEYEKAAAEAQAFKLAGYPAKDIPPMVAAWAISGRTAKESADSIIAEADAYNTALTVLRTTRLAGKAKAAEMMAAPGFDTEKLAAAVAYSDEVVATIQALVASLQENSNV